MMPFRVGRGLEGRHSSMSLSEPSSSGTSMSESSSFTAENIFYKMLNHKNGLRWCDYCFAFSVTGCLTGTTHQILLLLPQFVLHHPQRVFSFLQGKQKREHSETYTHLHAPSYNCSVIMTLSFIQSMQCQCLWTVHIFSTMCSFSFSRDALV